MSFPPKIHLLQSIHHPTHLGFFHDNKPFIIGFTRSQEVIYATRMISQNVTPSLLNYHGRDVTEIVEQGLLEMGRPRQLSEIRVQEHALLRLSKEITPMFDWMIDSIPTHFFFQYPIHKGIGIVMPMQKTIETDTEIIYTCQVVEPMNDIDLFRKSLHLD